LLYYHSKLVGPSRLCSLQKFFLVVLLVGWIFPPSNKVDYESEAFKRDDGEGELGGAENVYG
jgi:hypothetical protein